MLQMEVSAFEIESVPQKDEWKKGCSKSKLERYVDTLEFLVSNGPMTLRLIMQQTEFGCAITLENLSFLVKLNLVKAQTSKYEVIYLITERGERVVRFFGKQADFAQLQITR
jgi:predicted transcriptional regulator